MNTEQMGYIVLGMGIATMLYVFFILVKISLESYISFEVSEQLDSRIKSKGNKR